VTLLPAAVDERLRAHLREVKALHERDLAAGFGRVVLPDALARNQAGFLEGLGDRRTERGPLLHERVVRRSSGEAIGRVEDAVVVALHFRLRMLRAVGP
jgi:hypothetical protein